ncbi:MAG: CPBP family intramembrane metalloprotease [Deltaproteobacteria bacterium]|nr:CPBP family intramembrane metalloprotease [Deltaproteobacteria bacterium]
MNDAGPKLDRRDLGASLVLIAPLFFLYQVGVLFAGNVNGADVVTRAVYGGLGRTNYLLAAAALGLGFLLWLRRSSRSHVLRLDIVLPVVLEAAIYALTLGALVNVVLERMLGLGLDLGEAINAAGAGVHEELVFRLALCGGLIAVLSRTQLSRPLIVIFALLVSSVVFSAAHHLGPYGEPFTQHAFAFRCLAGLVFGLVFYFRSLAHAVYAHTFYDLLVYWRE